MQKGKVLSVGMEHLRLADVPNLCREIRYRIIRRPDRFCLLSQY